LTFGWRTCSRRIGQALILLQAAELRIATAHGDGELTLGETDAAAKAFQQYNGDFGRLENFGEKWQVG